MRELVKMTIPCYLSPLGTSLGKYKPDEIICDLSNGETAEVTFYPGVWYIETQGGGGSGGTYGDFGWGRGSGGGSGAGFKGLIRVKKTITCNISTAVAVASGKWSVKGNPTEIENMFLCDGGEGGHTNEALSVGGELTVIENDSYEILSSEYRGNGNGTKVVDGNKRYGGDSVITNDGGGLPSANATSFGAGGGGYTGSGINGGAGGAGSCLIKFVGYYGIKAKELNVEYVGKLNIINDYILSGFAVNNHTLIPQIPPTENYTWEFSSHFKTGSSVMGGAVLGLSGGVDFDCPILGTSSSTGKFVIYLSSNGTKNDIASNVQGTYQPLINTWYYVKFGWDGSTYYLDYSLDGSKYIRDISVSSDLPIFSSKYKWAIGNDVYGSGQVPFKGIIDLANTSLKINNNIWWQGTKEN